MQILLHPRKKESKKHKILQRDLIEILKKNKSNKRVNKKKSSTIIIGASSSILEALENGLKPYHICEDHLLEMCSNYLWPSIKVTTIFENCYQYKLKKLNNNFI